MGCSNSALGHKQTFQWLVDYFIGPAEQRRRHGEAEHSGGLCIDDADLAT
jgi:hypothetical protein